MKNKINKILGISLTVAILASLLTVAIPVSAGTLSWSEESTGKLSNDAVSQNQLAPNTDVMQIKVEGSTLYAVAGNATGTRLVKSTNGGTSWNLVTVFSAAENPQMVAIAPGDANTVLVISTNATATNINLSTDGGITFSQLTPSNSAVTTINSIAISPSAAGTRYLALAGVSGAVADIQYLPIGGLVSVWTSVANTAVTTGDSGVWQAVTNGGTTLGTASVLSIAFSPNFGGDRVLTAVTTSTANTTNFEVLSFASRKINGAAGFVGYPVSVLGATSTKAAISLSPTYLGADDTLRTAFVAVSTGVNTGGLFRLDNATKRIFQDTVDFASVAFNGTDLVAGADATNNVYYSANPMAAIASVVVSNTSGFQRPGGLSSGVGASTMTQVAWAGANAVAGTSGPTSAFGVSKDKGVTFNDVSLIDGAQADVLFNITDIGVSADGNTVLSASNDGVNTSIWKKVSAWERILTLDGVRNIIIRLDVSQNVTNIYLVELGSTNLWFSNDGGEKSWVARNSLLNPAVDVAVESAQVLYALSASGRVSKSNNAGFTFDAEVSTGLTTGASIKSVRTNQLLVGGTDGTIAWSTDGNAAANTWVSKTGTALPQSPSTWLAAPVGKVFLTADNLTNGMIYAVQTGTNKDVIRWNVGTSTSFSDIITGGTTNATGIALNDGVLYVIGTTGGDSFFIRNLAPRTAGSSSPTGDFSGTIQATHTHGRTPQTLKVSTGAKFWVVDVNTANVPATADQIHSFVDTTYKTAITPSAPADKAAPPVNTVTGRAQDMVFTWPRLGVTIAGVNGYKLEIALDSAFTQIIFTGDNTTGALPNTLVDPVVIIVGPDQPAPRNYPFAPGVTYYWRVKAVFPMESPASTTRSFSIVSLAAPFALKGPTVGQTNVPIQPILSWSDYAGALWYELTVSEDPTFAIPEFSHNVGAGIKPPTTFYGVTETLKYSTTYYWRVRGVTAEPFVQGTTVVTPAGPWQTGAFTTMADPAKAPGAVGPGTPATPAAPVVVTVPEVKVVEVPGATQIVQQQIPQWTLITIIVIGAVLIIALIVLIVRTRRVA